MPYEISIIIVIFAILLLFFALYRYVKDRLEFYSSLGATVVGYNWLINPKAELVFKNLRFKLFTSGPRGSHRLKLTLPIKPCGYLRVRKIDFLDKILQPETYKGFALEYDEEDWAYRLIKIPEFEKLLEELFSNAKVDLVELDCNNLTVSWYIRRSLKKDLSKDRVLNAVELLAQAQEALNQLPLAQVYRENLRNLLTIKIPVLTVITSTMVGLVLGFYKYQPVCYLEAIQTGYKWLLAPAIVYTAFTLFLTGGKTLWKRIVFRVSLFYLFGSLFITTFLLTYVNGRFDQSQAELRWDTISSKYRSSKGGWRVTLYKLHGNRWWCEAFSVSEDFYRMAYEGAEVEYWTKRGFLSIEWLYRGLRLKEKAGDGI
ncbi:MAG: hypothetical protein RMK35_05655 [Aquificaceae bacterium]|nr:hypothetical protein [Aquificaceae bacterium]MDW8434273.1 hypothetical protein [Aquificaceae bacterium]